MKVASALPWTSDVWGRLTQQAQQGRLGHAILLVGQEGTGKRVLLREMAQFLLCDGQEKPCGQCAQCSLFNAGSHPDLLMVEPEEKGKQVKIEQIRRVTDFVNTTPQKSKHKVVLLGPAEAMNINASNALLKSLEEPSKNVTLLLYSHQPSSLLATIKSRCQQSALYPPSWQQGLAWLQQNSEEPGLDNLLRLAKGAPLKALEMVEQDVHVQYMQFCQSLRDLAKGSAAWTEVLGVWKTWDQQNLLQWFYELLLDAQKQQAGVSELAMPDLADMSKMVGQKTAYGSLQGLVSKVVESLKAIRSQSNPNPQLLIETLLIDWLALMGQARG